MDNKSMPERHCRKYDPCCNSVSKHANGHRESDTKYGKQHKSELERLRNEVTEAGHGGSSL